MATVFTLEPALVPAAVLDAGLDAFGLTMPKLSDAWATGTPSASATTLQLTPGSGALAPWRGTLEYRDAGVAFRDISGAPITGGIGVFHLHPQAVARLDRVMALRYAPPGQPHHRPLPVAMVLHLSGAAPNVAPEIYEPGEALPSATTLSFHDHRGLILDPVAVAGVFDDLMTFQGALNHQGVQPGTGQGSVQSIAGQLAAGTVVQVTDLHGRPFAARSGGPGVHVQNSSNTSVGALSQDGLAPNPLSTGDRLTGTRTNAATRIALGWASGGVMGAGPLTLPTITQTAPHRQFLRAFATDLDWHLRGNRSSSVVRGVPRDDGRMPADLQPSVHTDVTIDYPIDGIDVMSQANRVLSRLTGSGTSNLVFAASPVLDDDVMLPPAPGTGATRWPALPAPNSGTGFAAGTADPLRDASGAVTATATWTTGLDVVVTFAAGSFPNGASVRLYPQRFALIQRIDEAPSFLRSDGGTGIADTSGAASLLVTNPFGLATGDTKPTFMVFDLVVAARDGAQRFFAAERLDIAVGPATAPADPFAPATDAMAALPDTVKSVASAPLFGVPRRTVPSGSPSNAVDIARALASESAPRDGPRFPTMGRLETVIVSGLSGSAAFSNANDWDALLTGARWSRETLSEAHRVGNPGNPAGPDTLSGGVRVTGGLAYDLARHAMRRVQSVLPLPAGGSTPASLGWVTIAMGDNMDPPVRTTPGTGGTSSGVALTTVAPRTDSPELSLFGDTTPLANTSNTTFDALVDQIAI